MNIRLNVPFQCFFHQLRVDLHRPVMGSFAYAHNKRISYYDAVTEQMQSICMLL